MAEFYRFPHWALTTLVMAAALCIVFQTRAISYSIRRLPTGWVRRVENGMECAILGVLFLFAALLAQVQYGLFCGFLAPSAYGLVRQAVFLLTAVLGTTAAVGMELIWPFFAVGGAAVLLPLTETVTGLNCTPFVRQYDILTNKWGALLCQKGYQTNVIHQNSRNEWLRPSYKMVSATRK